MAKTKQVVRKNRSQTPSTPAAVTADSLPKNKKDLIQWMRKRPNWANESAKELAKFKLGELQQMVMVCICCYITVFY